MKKAEVPGIITFNNKAANDLAKDQAKHMVEKGVRKKPFQSNINLPASTMGMKDVFITETSKPIIVALASGGLYNFHLAPGVRLSGVVVYTGETGYSKTKQAAVAGIPEGVPVNFISQSHKATKACWTRIQTRPDKSWAKRIHNNERYKALMPHWRTFFNRVKKDIGSFPEKNVISVSKADHFLIGPAPVRYEDRLPYVAFAGKTIHYSATDHASFGTSEQNKKYARGILDQYYETHLAAARK